MVKTRREHDSFGVVVVPDERLWGAQTERSLAFFSIGDEPMPVALLQAIVLVKRCAAEVNAELGLLEPATARAIVSAADEVLSGRWPDEFPLSVWQTGSGTQSHMNVNEVLANRASELLGGPRGERRLVHPNDHVNLGQSSNDVVPTAMHVAAAAVMRDHLRPALAALRQALTEKALAFTGVIKVGRTHLQDATPITLGQELSGHAAQLDACESFIDAAQGALASLAIGGTAVGTGLNTHPEFGARVAGKVSAATAFPFVADGNKFALLGSHDALVHMHGTLRTLATTLTKIANDIRWMASGPRAGLGELRIPENEPGSSIMPGKVNPTQAEALLMVCAQVMGHDVAVGIAGSSGHFELNVAKPLIIRNVLHSSRLLADGMASFTAHCIRGIVPVEVRMRELVERSLMLVTALSPHIGYDRAAAVARKAYADNSTVRDAALALGFASGPDLDVWLRLDSMLGPR